MREIGSEALMIEAGRVLVAGNGKKDGKGMKDNITRNGKHIRIIREEFPQVIQ